MPKGNQFSLQKEIRVKINKSKEFFLIDLIIIINTIYSVHVQSNIIAQPGINTELQLLKTIVAQEHSSIYNNNNNNRYCALDTKV